MSPPWSNCTTATPRTRHRKTRERNDAYTDDAPQPDREDVDGWTLRRLRHGALTHDASDGTPSPMLLARPGMVPSGP